jgi:putative ubiquitin-RnfH superfamily antitoxin RatB of RatAB toxin-antitoxin module
MKVEVVAARADGADIVTLTLPAGATVRDAVAAAHLAGTAFGIFGKRVSPDAKLADGDRVEVYRPLAMDPKEARRRRAKASSPRRRGAK